MQTVTTNKADRAPTVHDEAYLWDVEFHADTTEWHTVLHTKWQGECWVVWHPSGIRVVTNAGGNEPVRDFGQAKGWFGVITRKDGAVVPVEFHGTDTSSTILWVKMLTGYEDGGYVVGNRIWPVSLSDIHRVYFW